MSNLTTLGKTAQTYAKDLAERVVWTFLTASAGVAVAAGPADMFRVSFWQGVGTAGIAAAGSLLKGVVARVIGDKNSASTAPGV
ncbi:hypothetical protein [Streptomyces sp. ME19-01-6]|uniref:hypothetical protein n=1 Tax=Streptomyces sp. ME19-01-6 TaxID=3028686 RepID=UPI0029B1D530|nr:hypothetical protein [Streptomyces sp. ME19-01-6]MDX3230650.1 hypothetical protein [Streptomyces sp. ME19-01-6]